MQYNRSVGRAFQYTALGLIGIAISGHPAAENTRPFGSPARGAALGLGAGQQSDVIPDAVGSITYTVLENGVPVMSKTFNQSLFVEVKAVNAPTPWYGFGWIGGLNLSYSKFQIAGLVDITRRSDAGRSGQAPGMLLFISTDNTDINNKVLWNATSSNVAVWQSKAVATQDPTGKWYIGFTAPTLLNPEVFAKYNPPATSSVLVPTPLFIGNTKFAPLTPAPDTRTGADQDPTELQQ